MYRPDSGGDALVSGLAVDQSDRPWPGQQGADSHQTKPTDCSSQIQLDQSDLAQPDSMQDHYESGDNDNEEKPLLGMRVLCMYLKNCLGKRAVKK